MLEISLEERLRLEKKLGNLERLEEIKLENTNTQNAKPLSMEELTTLDDGTEGIDFNLLWNRSRALK